MVTQCIHSASRRLSALSALFTLSTLFALFALFALPERPLSTLSTLYTMYTGPRVDVVVVVAAEFVCHRGELGEEGLGDVIHEWLDVLSVAPPVPTVVPFVEET